MFDELRLYLQASQSPEYCRLVDQACQVLDRAGETTYSDGIMRLIDQTERVGQEQTLLDIHETLLDYLYQCLEAFSIGIDESTPMGMMTLLLDGVLRIDDYGDPQSILDALNMEGSSEEQLARILAYTGGSLETTVGLYLHSCHPDLLDQIRQQIEPQLAMDDDDPMLSIIRQRLRAFIQRHPESLVNQRLREGLIIGQTLEALLVPELETLESLQRQPRVLVETLSGLVLASRCDNADVQDVIYTEAEGINDSLQLVAQYPLLITQTLAGVIDHEQA